MLSYLVLAVAGLAAGALNAVAGGGTFLSFPALVWAGVPPVAANATATLSALPGYAASAWAYRRELRAQGALTVRAIVLIAVAGGLLGAALLLVTPQRVFSDMVPWLLLLATVVFAAGPWFVRQLAGRGVGAPGVVVAGGLLLAVTIYGGYFNGGLGILLLAAFGLVGFTDLHAMNGLKNMVSAVLSFASVTAYAAAGLIDWRAAALLGVATALGGVIGAQIARRVRNTAWLRAFITAVGAGMTVAFFSL